MKCDPRVIELMHKHETIFMSRSFQMELDELDLNEENLQVLKMVIVETVYYGRTKAIMDLEQFDPMPDIGKTSFDQWLTYFNDRKILIVSRIEDDYTELREVGFNIFRFGNIFPTYEEAVTQLEAQQKVKSKLKQNKS